jgi:hypothetical protein
MTRRQEQRKARLLKEGFAPFEARGFVNIKLSDPVMLYLRKERRAALRSTHKMKVSQSALYRQYKVLYQAEGWYKGRRYQPLALFASYTGKVKEIEDKRIRGLQARQHREERAAKPERGYEARFRALLECKFLVFEARILATMAHIRPENRNKVFNTHPWVAMRETRLRLVADLRAKGYSDREIRLMIRNWYRTGKVSDPYQFLRREYRPKQKPLLYRVAEAVMPKKQPRRRAAMIWD